MENKSSIESTMELLNSGKVVIDNKTYRKAEKEIDKKMEENKVKHVKFERGME